MIPLVSPAFELKRRTASNVIPAWVVGLLGGLQVVLWLAIGTLEIINLYHNAFRGTAYVGILFTIVFLTTWISMFCFRKYIYIFVSHDALLI